MDAPLELTNVKIVHKNHTVVNYTYFAVITIHDSFGEQIYNSRKYDRLPATIIKLPNISEICDVPASISSHHEITPRQVAAVLEQVLCYSESNELVHVGVTPKPSFLSHLATAAGITIPKDVQNTTTLSDLGMSVEKSSAVHVSLRDVYNVSLAEEELPNFTIQMLQEIEETLQYKEFENVIGLKAFFSYVDSDELLASTEMVTMPTLSSGSIMNDYEIYVNETSLCIIPGVEGHYARFYTLCERFKLPAMVLQPGLHHPHEIVLETARRYAKVLLEKTKMDSNFYLLGYESGVLVALEVAAILEDHGLSGTVFCLGAPPQDFNKELLEHLRGLDTEEALQDAVIQHMLTLMMGVKEDEGQKLSAILCKAKSWHEKVEGAVRLLLGRVSYSAQYARQLMEAARGRLVTLLRHEDKPRALRSRRSCCVLRQRLRTPPPCSRTRYSP